MVRLYPASEIFVNGDPQENGFYALELPDAFRWIKQEARCLIPAKNIAHLSTPMLQVTASAGRNERYLSIYLNGDFLGTQRIGSYGSYYFHVPPKRLTTSGPVEIG